MLNLNPSFTYTIFLGGLLTLLLYPLFPQKYKTKYIWIVPIELLVGFFAANRYFSALYIQPQNMWLVASFISYITLLFCVKKSIAYYISYALTVFYLVLFTPFLHIGCKYVWDTMMPTTMYDNEIVIEKTPNYRVQLVNNMPLLSSTKELQLIKYMKFKELKKIIGDIKDCDSLSYTKQNDSLHIKIIHTYDSSTILDTLLVP